MALTDSLDELITSGAITPQLAMKVLMQVCVFLLVESLRESWASRVVWQVLGRHISEAGKDKDNIKGSMQL